MISKNMYTIGIDVGGTSVKLGLLNDSWKIVAREVVPIHKYDIPEKFFIEMRNTIMSMFDKQRIDKSLLCGIGLGLPGCVDSENGIVCNLTNMPGWDRVDVTNGMLEVIGIPAYIDNDVNLMTIGEWMHGAGKGSNNMVCCTIGTGVGGGLVIDGNLYRGTNLCAGEIGHMSLFPDGDICNCGNKGCLERYVGNAGIVKRTVNMLKDNPHDGKILKDMVDGNLESLTPKIIFEASKKGDKISTFIWEETGYYIGVIFTSVVNMLNPQKIVVGGGIAQAGDILFNSIINTVKKRAITVAVKNLEIIPAKLGEDAGIYGAATYGIMKHSKPELLK